MRLVTLPLFLSVAVGEITPGATVQKGPAASRQEVYAGRPPSSHTSHVSATCVNTLSSFPLLLPPFLNLPPLAFLFSLPLSPSSLPLLLPYTEQLSSIPEFAQLGPLFRSSDKPTELTESETEYVVNCVKHVFSKHIVFQVCLSVRLLTGVAYVPVCVEIEDCSVAYNVVQTHCCIESGVLPHSL